MTKIPTINNALISPSIIGKTISAGNSERCFCSKGSSGALFAIESVDEKKKIELLSMIFQSGKNYINAGILNQRFKSFTCCNVRLVHSANI